MKFSTLATLSLASSLLALGATARMTSHGSLVTRHRHISNEAAPRFLKSKRSPSLSSISEGSAELVEALIVKRHPLTGHGQHKKRTDHLQEAPPAMPAHEAAAAPAPVAEAAPVASHEATSAVVEHMATSEAPAAGATSSAAPVHESAAPPPPAHESAAPALPQEAPVHEAPPAAEASAANTTAPATAEKCIANAGSVETDLLVLQFAGLLERLETAFYIAGLATFSQPDMEKAGFSSAQAQIIIETLAVIIGDESKHVDALTATIGALGATPNMQCGFDFTAALTDPVTFLATARALEMVGVSAYAGGSSLISNKSILIAAAQIRPIEARHGTVLNILNAGSAIPQAFDMALTPQSVLALAGSFLTGCQASDIGLTSNAPLSVKNRATASTAFTTGDHLAFVSTVSPDPASTFCAMLVGGAAESITLPVEQCQIPEGIDGPVYIYLTSSATPLAADIIVQDASSILAGPGLIFVESSHTLLQDVFTVQGGGERYYDNGKKHASRPSSDLGYVGYAKQAGIVESDAKAWWNNHRIAVETTVGVAARALGFD